MHFKEIEIETNKDQKRVVVMKENNKNKLIPSILELQPVATASGEDADNPILQLQLAMATSSINHEYARIEYDESPDLEKREELLDFMNECRSKYFDAREKLLTYNPDAVSQFEKDLLLQKKNTLNRYDA